MTSRRRDGGGGPDPTVDASSVGLPPEVEALRAEHRAAAEEILRDIEALDAVAADAPGPDEEDVEHLYHHVAVLRRQNAILMKAMANQSRLIRVGDALTAHALGVTAKTQSLIVERVLRLEGELEAQRRGFDLDGPDTSEWGRTPYDDDGGYSDE